MVALEQNLNMENFWEADLDDLADMGELLKTTNAPAEGDIVEGIIVEIEKSEIFVDIGYKSEGLLSPSEFDKSNPPAVGDKVTVLLEFLEDDKGNIILSKSKAEKIRQWNAIVKDLEEGSVVEGSVIRKIKGGLIVDIGIESFLPASQLDIRPVYNFDEFIGKSLKFKIVKINTSRKNIVLSRRNLLEEERLSNRDELLSTINVGDLTKGVVKNITNFGVFVDLGGLDGLLHITDMSWGRINHPSQIVSIGDPLEVVILDIDKEKARVSLGIKQKTPNPWTKISEKYPVGTVLPGRVVNLMHYGAFVELEDGVEALLHISEISWTRRLFHPSEMFKVGDEIQVIVLSINNEEHKISLGFKQIQKNPWDTVEEDFSVGMKVQGIVRNLTDYGVFAEIREGIDGLIHISDMSWTKRINHPSEILKKGDAVDAIVLSVDATNEKISLGMKQVEDDPWKSSIMEYSKNQEVKGTIIKIASFGIFIEFDKCLEGLIHNSQLVRDEEKKLPIDQTYKKDDPITAYISKVDTQQRKISLTMFPSSSKNFKPKL